MMHVDIRTELKWMVFLFPRIFQGVSIGKIGLLFYIIYTQCVKIAENVAFKKIQNSEVAQKKLSKNIGDN